MRKITVVVFILLISIQASCQLPYWGNRSPIVPYIPSEECRSYRIVSESVHVTEYSYTTCDGEWAASGIAGVGTTHEICAMLGSVWATPTPPPALPGAVTITNLKCCECEDPSDPGEPVNIAIGFSYMLGVVPKSAIGSIQIDLYTAATGGSSYRVYGPGPFHLTGSDQGGMATIAAIVPNISNYTHIEVTATAKKPDLFYNSVMKVQPRYLHTQSHLATEVIQYDSYFMETKSTARLLLSHFINPDGIGYIPWMYITFYPQYM